MEVGRGKTRKEARGERTALLLGCACVAYTGRKACSGLVDGRAWEQRAGTGQLELEPEAL